MVESELLGVPAVAILLMLAAIVMLFAWWALEVDEDRKWEESQRDKVYNWAEEGDFMREFDPANDVFIPGVSDYDGESDD